MLLLSLFRFCFQGILLFTKKNCDVTRLRETFENGFESHSVLIQFKIPRNISILFTVVLSFLFCFELQIRTKYHCLNIEANIFILILITCRLPTARKCKV